MNKSTHQVCRILMINAASQFYKQWSDRIRESYLSAAHASNMSVNHVQFLIKLSSLISKSFIDTSSSISTSQLLQINESSNFRLFEGNSFSDLSHVSIINVSLLCWCFICECCFRCGVWRFLITIQTDNVKSQSIENSCSWQWLCCGDFFSAHGILFMMGARVVWDSCLVWCPF